MPITQDRMVALIKAAKAYKTAFDGFDTILGELCMELVSGKITVSEFGLKFDSSRKLLYPAPDHVTAIAVEETHFNKVFKKNIVKKESMRQRHGFQPLRTAANIPGNEKPNYQAMFDNYVPSQPPHRPEPEEAPQGADPYADYFPPGYIPRHLRPEPVFSVNPPGWVPPQAAREPSARGEPDPEGAEPPAEGEAVF